MHVSKVLDNYLMDFYQNEQIVTKQLDTLMKKVQGQGTIVRDEFMRYKFVSNESQCDGNICFWLIGFYHIKLTQISQFLEPIVSIYFSFVPNYQKIVVNYVFNFWCITWQCCIPMLIEENDLHRMSKPIMQLHTLYNVKKDFCIVYQAGLYDTVQVVGVY